MKELIYSCNCLMKLDLLKSKDKFAFLNENWPNFAQIESIDRYSEKDLLCSLCFLDIVIDALAKDELFCSNKEIIRLMMTRTYVQNKLEICEVQELQARLTDGDTQQAK